MGNPPWLPNPMSEMAGHMSGMVWMVSHMSGHIIGIVGEYIVLWNRLNGHRSDHIGRAMDTAFKYLYGVHMTCVF